MTTLREAATMALEALEAFDSPISIPSMDALKAALAMDVLRAALAEPVQEPTVPSDCADSHQPVAWMVYTFDGKSVCVTDNPADFTEQHKALPLYTAPPRCPNCASLEAQNESLRQIVEDFPPIEAELQEVSDRAHRVEAQRDALLEALKEIEEHTMDFGAIECARAAIAKVEGQA